MSMDFNFTCGGAAGPPAPARPPSPAAPKAAGHSTSSLAALLAGAGDQAKVFTPVASGFGSSTAGAVDSALSSRAMGRRAAYPATLFAASSMEREIMKESFGGCAAHGTAALNENTLTDSADNQCCH